MFVGIGNVTAYKVASSPVAKPAGGWAAEAKARLDTLCGRSEWGELRSYLAAPNAPGLHAVFAAAVGAWVVMGGMGTANEGRRSIRNIVFSVLPIPTGLDAIGGCFWARQLWARALVSSEHETLCRCGRVVVGAGRSVVRPR